jgi:hypothetical protein
MCVFVSMFSLTSGLQTKKNLERSTTMRLSIVALLCMCSMATLVHGIDIDEQRQLEEDYVRQDPELSKLPKLTREALEAAQLSLLPGAMREEIVAIQTHKDYAVGLPLPPPPLQSRDVNMRGRVERRHIAGVWTATWGQSVYHDYKWLNFTMTFGDDGSLSTAGGSLHEKMARWQLDGHDGDAAVGGGDAVVLFQDVRGVRTCDPSIVGRYSVAFGDDCNEMRFTLVEDACERRGVARPRLQFYRWPRQVQCHVGVVDHVKHGVELALSESGRAILGAIGLLVALAFVVRGAYIRRHRWTAAHKSDKRE